MIVKKVSVLFLVLICSAYGGYVFVNPTDFGGGNWQYNYTITALEEPIAGVRIWFDYNNYSNFSITTADAGGWSQSLIVPENWLKQGAGFNIFNWNSPLQAGQTLSQQYSISFSYSGSDAPSLIQKFDIINSDWQTVRSETTVPEPASFVVMAFAALALRKRKKQSKPS